jgi:nucleotide-binding universal stress UspA family protein
MFKRILVPLDGSKLAEEALGRLKGLLKGVDLVIARSGEANAREQTEAESYLGCLTLQLEAEGIRPRIRIGQGPAAEGILSIIEDEKPGLVALTTHGRRGLERWTLGSVAEKLIRHSPAPVLVFRAFEPSESFLPKRILVPIDSAGLALEAIPAAAVLARKTGGCLIVLHVSDESHAMLPEPELRKAYDRAREEGVACEPRLRKGDPAEQILAAAAEEKADLIAMTTHGRSGPARWVLGSVAEKVLRGADRPLLVVRVHPAPLVPVAVGTLFA